MKKILFIALSVVLAVSLPSCKNGAKKAQASSEAADSLAAADSTVAEKSVALQLSELPEEPVFDIRTNYGTIRVKLYADTPKHRDNFAKLALEGFYDEVRFHRVINGFMIQAGDPLSRDVLKTNEWGTGGPGYTVPAEIRPNHTHKKGALAAARIGDMANPRRESSGSQFYLVQSAESCRHLDGAYSIFGETIEGLDVIDLIAGVFCDYRDRPVDDVIIEGVKLVK